MARSRAYFDPVDPQVNFPELEKKLLKSWEKTGLLKKYLERNKKSKKNFSFLDGPITANGPMGVHHAWGRTYKDVWQRYKNMQGYRQRFQNGFDAQGLWVEVQVEKELGFKTKKDIEKFGVAKFVQLCRERVKKYSAMQTTQSNRLGYFMDWDHSYYTLSDDNNYMIWSFLKKCYESGWIYKGKDSVPWCPRCETAISQHEMLTEDYKETTHESVYLAFPLVGADEEYLLVWTTTPWTVPANIGVAVDVDLDYSLVETGARKYWIAKDAVERVLNGGKVKILKTVKGAKLVGLRYKGAFDHLAGVVKVAKDDKFHVVIATDDLIMPITTTEGTGLVHTAVSAGTEDFKLGEKLNLPMIPVIADDASYIEGFGKFSGQNAKVHPELILDYLKDLNANGHHFIYKTEKFTHRYPACWRCKTELVWKVTDEWYISMDAPSKPSGLKASLLEVGERWQGEEKQKPPDDLRTLREKMIEVTKKINWLPAFGLERELDWLANMHDWLISKKNRYWGLALPIWECKKCGNFEVIGSKEELKGRAVEGWKDFEGKTPHKPQIDKVKIKCSKCGAVMERIEPVGNPWLDAGIVAFSTISENNQAANFELTKTKPLYLNDKVAWKEWFPADFITEGFIGQFKNWFYALIAMSTVMENEPSFKTVLGHGTVLGEDGRPMHKSWGNSIDFNEAADKIGVDVMRWMYCRQNPADNLLFGYRTADETRRRFHLKLWNIYNFFVTYANLDGWRPANHRLSTSNQSILDKWILIRLNQLVKSVGENLDKYDAFTATGEIEKFVDDLSLWYVRRSRDRIGPVAESEGDRNVFYGSLYFVLCTLSKLLAPFNPFLSDYIYHNLTKDESIHLSDWVLMKGALSKKDLEILEEMQSARDAVEKAHALRKEKSISLKQPLALFYSSARKISRDIEELVKAEINVKRIVWGAKVEKLDTKVTKELEEEAKTRDLIRKIQDQRKKMGLNLTQKVDVKIEKIPTDTKLVQWMIKKAQIRNLTEGDFKVAKA